ncbi:MAG: tetraacyldisaccharide 4'-kinase [Pyrinomonadaceae bacterium]
MSPISSLVLPPLSALYRAVTQTRLAAYRRGLLAVTKLDAPVISVGNITTGGTGKTPLVEWVCRVLARDKRKVCILTRGYGRANPGARVVVSDGVTVQATGAEAGDEPFLLAQSLNGLAAVISDQDRVAAGRWAIQNLGMEVFVLDDGFQHLRLSRDLNILTVDATNPWGGGTLLPHGRLREPRREASRADCVVITRADQTADLVSLQEEIGGLIDSRPMFNSRMRVKCLTNMTSGLPEEITALPQPFTAFCAIGNPQAFFDQLRRAEIRLAFTRAFQDHHRYTREDVESLLQMSDKFGAQSMITTAKDAVKLTALNLEIPCYVLNIEISIEREHELVEMIEAAIRE